jgi:hypothetical protein
MLLQNSKRLVRRRAFRASEGIGATVGQSRPISIRAEGAVDASALGRMPRGKISKRGNHYLRVLFVQAAWVVLIKPIP